MAQSQLKFLSPSTYLIEQKNASLPFKSKYIYDALQGHPPLIFSITKEPVMATLVRQTSTHFIILSINNKAQ